MPIRHILQTTGGLMLLCAVASGAQAADKVVLLQGGSIGTAQVAAGAEAYLDNCAGCHGEDLRSVNSNAPDLRGPTFQYSWVTKPLEETFHKIITTMPPGMTGEIDPETYAQIVAYILNFNGVEAQEDGRFPQTAEEVAPMDLVIQ
ncbi:Cytochrome c [Aquimixticola soesokkakensis]|uniref:Cytochrome c n=1 Tax=Aquimixticola soesokkakensis TaxID=1519096 RepID=A0A1Y5TMT8_9RHOB|nr:cytochrome c [Aquimixticola soesokkakensis]SLN63828.1 Cytochrome c [Aquimixticola soesokkakensis]